MAKYRHTLPQLDGTLFLTDGGIETTLIFHDGHDLPYFAAFDLLKDAKGIDALKRYYLRHAAVALRNEAGFILESATWRASPDWAKLLGYTPPELAEANRKAIVLLQELRDELETDQTRMVVSGCIGPRGDGYDPGDVMTVREAEAFHAGQVRVFAQSGADMVTAITMTNVPEAIGVARAAREHSMPVVIAFTVETDGSLPSGETLESAIRAVDAGTGQAPAYYMINCAHPSHFAAVLDGGSWTRRLGGLRANASRCSHAELDEAEELDEGDPVELGQDYADLLTRCPSINVLGGCCGTDHRHIEQIHIACRTSIAI